MRYCCTISQYLRVDTIRKTNDIDNDRNRNSKALQIKFSKMHFIKHIDNANKRAV